MGIKHIINCKVCNDEIIIYEGQRYKSYCSRKCINNQSYKKNRQKRIEYARRYRKEQKEWINTQRRELYKKNKEKIKERNKAYNLLNKEKYRRYNKKYRERNLELLKGYDMLRNLQFRLKKGFARCSNRKRYYLRWRKNKCEFCGFDIEVRVLDIHHIDESLKNTSKDSEKNCITLCKNCHLMIHLFYKEDFIALNERLKGT